MTPMSPAIHAAPAGVVLNENTQLNAVIAIRGTAPRQRSHSLIASPA
jgi:hypothetical protein